MKFIIPQNFDFKNKLFGFFDYYTLIFNVFWYVIVFIIFNFMFSNWNVKVFLIISFSFPLTLFSLFGLNGECITYVLKYIIKFLIRPKLYLFKKF